MQARLSGSALVYGELAVELLLNLSFLVPSSKDDARELGLDVEESFEQMIVL